MTALHNLRLHFWLLALDIIVWLGVNQGDPVYLWVLTRASNATDWTDPELIQLRLVVAPPISPDSWLHNDRHEHAREFRAFYSYLSNQTNAIETCSKCSPEELYTIISFYEHWRASNATDWRAE